MNIEEHIYQYGKWIQYGIIGIGIIVAILSIESIVSLTSKYFDLQRNLETLEVSAVEEQPATSWEVFEDIDLNKTVFESVSDAASVNKVVVKNINAPLIHKSDEHFLLTEEIILEGHFINLLKSVDLASKKLEHVKISSVKFERDNSPASKALFLKVYFQTVKSDGYEK